MAASRGKGTSPCGRKSAMSSRAVLQMGIRKCCTDELP